MRLRRTKDLSEYTIAAYDTDIGKVYDFYFDDQQWTIRYIVVGTGVILAGRKVLISPLALRHPAWSPLHIHVNLTWERVKDSPSIDVHKPVSRQHEAEHHKYYGLPHYWEGAGIWGSWPNPKALAEAPQTKKKPAKKSARSEPHLRSTREVIGYHIKASDGEVGHVDDFLFDDETWEIRYVIVDTKNWWPAKKVLLSPKWITRVSWPDRVIHVKMSCEMIRKSPDWNPEQEVSRKYELRLHKHYDCAPYWTPTK